MGWGAVSAVAADAAAPRLTLKMTIELVQPVEPLFAPLTPRVAFETFGRVADALVTFELLAANREGAGQG